MQIRRPKRVLKTPVLSKGIITKSLAGDFADKFLENSNCKCLERRDDNEGKSTGDVFRPVAFGFVESSQQEGNNDSFLCETDSCGADKQCSPISPIFPNDLVGQESGAEGQSVDKEEHSSSFPSLVFDHRLSLSFTSSSESDNDTAESSPSRNSPKSVRFSPKPAQKHIFERPTKEEKRRMFYNAVEYQVIWADYYREKTDARKGKSSSSVEEENDLVSRLNI